MLDFLQTIVSGIAVGSSYALMGLAMVLIYKTSEVVNFAREKWRLLPVFYVYGSRILWVSLLRSFSRGIGFFGHPGVHPRVAVLRRAKNLRFWE